MLRIRIQNTVLFLPWTGFLNSGLRGKNANSNSLRVFLDEISVLIGEVSKTDPPLSWRHE